jgi:hypothetical protein
MSNIGNGVYPRDKGANIGWKRIRRALLCAHDFSLTAAVQSRNFHASRISHFFNINQVVFIVSIFSASCGHKFRKHMRFGDFLSVPVYCVVTMLTVLDTRNVFGLLFVVILTTILFSVSKPCSVSYTCHCNGLSLTNDEGNCESLLGGHRNYINCIDTCVIPNNAFKAFPCQKCLDTVYLNYDNISDIHPDAFTDLKELEGLFLSNNEIQELHQSTFQNLRKLTTLDVSFNRLRYIHPETFVNMRSFYFLNVSHNDLVLKGTILHSDYINILDAAFCNPEKDASWYVLKYPVFSGLPNLTKLVLEGNSIQCVMWDTFSNNRRLKNLDLQNNMLKVMSHQTTLCSHVIELDLSNNPIECNCHMRMFSASCSSVKLDEVLCGTTLGLEDLSCDMSLTDPPDTGTCDIDIGSTQAVTSALPTSEDTTQGYANSAVFSATSETAISDLYSDQHSPTSEYNTSNKNERLVEFSVTPTAEIQITLSQDPDVTLSTVLLTKSYMWYVFGTVVVLVVIIVTVSVVVVLRVCRRQDIEGSTPATHYFNFHFGKRNSHTYDKVNENNGRRDYISIHSLQKLIPPKPDLHYSCRDVTTLSEMPVQGQPASRPCSCSLLLDTNFATARRNGDNEENVYEEIL